MLLSLRIENFALIDTLDLTFTDGLNVLTGETGAGKSILLDAIDLILGGKALSSMLRTGESRTLLEASFSLTPNLHTWLADTDIDPLDDLLVCSREISTQNTLRSRFRVNGVVVNKQQVAQLREQLIEVTAQGQARAARSGRSSASVLRWLWGRAASQTAAASNEGFCPLAKHHHRTQYLPPKRAAAPPEHRSASISTARARCGQSL